MTSKRVLVVEDDIHLSNAIYRALRLSYGAVDLTWVTTEESAEVEISKSHFDIILSDYLLPGVRDGVDLWNHCSRHSPTTPFMLISAVPFEDILRRFRKNEAVPTLLPKPFQLQELIVMFKGCL